MPGAPVALDKPPGPGHVDRVPGVPEPVVLKLDPGLVAGGLAVTLDHDAVKTGVAEEKIFCNDTCVWSSDNKCHKGFIPAHQRTSVGTFYVLLSLLSPSGGSIKRMMKTFDFTSH